MQAVPKHNDSANVDLYGIDILKYIFAIIVALYHIGPPDIPFKYIDGILGSIGVPFYYMVSGFFIERSLQKIPNMQQKRQWLFRRAWKVFLLYLLWIAIYLPTDIFNFYTHRIPFVKAFGILFADVFCMGHSSYAWMLWYLYSMAAVLALYALVVRWRCHAVALALLFLGCYIFDFPDNFSMYPERLMPGGRFIFSLMLRGGIYMFVGGALFHIMSRRSLSVFILPLGLCALLLSYFELPFWHIVGGCFFFLLGYYVKLPASTLWLSLRVQSAWIFYLHLYVFWVIHTFLPFLTHYHILYWCGFLSAIIVMGIVLQRLQAVPRLSFLSHLIK